MFIYFSELLKHKVILRWNDSIRDR